MATPRLPCPALTLTPLAQIIGQAKSANELESFLPKFFNTKNVNAHLIGSIFELFTVVDDLVEETEKTARAVDELTAQVEQIHENQTINDTERREEYAKLAEEARLSPSLKPNPNPNPSPNPYPDAGPNVICR